MERHTAGKGKILISIVNQWSKADFQHVENAQRHKNILPQYIFVLFLDP